jgi:hypothetical protein
VVRFHEEQSFASVWLWLIAGAAILVMVSIASKDGAGVALFIPVALFASFVVWFLYLKLVTEVRGNALELRFRGLFVDRVIPLSDIIQFGARRYRPLIDFGGWGIRWSLFGKGMAYNVSGDRGVQLVLRNGSRILVGSQRAEELAAAIETARQR